MHKYNFELNISNITRKSDTLGIIASSLCLVHCVFTPILFLASIGIGVHKTEHPVWWGFLDLLFLSVSFIAIWWSAKATSKVGMKYAFWISWVLLLLLIVNEKLHLTHLPEGIVYFVTLFLVLLHLYNQNYCQCENQKCCTNKIQ